MSLTLNAEQESRISRVRAVGFDLDGTLYAPSKEVDDAIRTYMCEEAARITGRQPEVLRAEFDRLYRSEQPTGSGKHLDSKGTLMKLGVPDYEQALRISVSGLEKARIHEVLRKDENLVRILNKLRAKKNVFLITGSAREDAHLRLAALGLPIGWFQPKLYAEDEARGILRTAESGSAFDYVKDILGINKRDMMFVGDRAEKDIIPAHAHGITTVLVHSKKDCEEAHFKLESIHDIEVLVDMM